MKGYQKVKLFKFEGTGAEKRCVGKVNRGLKKGWTPISMSTYISQTKNKPVILVLMGKIEEEKEGYVEDSTNIEEEKAAEEDETPEEIEEKREEETEGELEEEEEVIEETPEVEDVFVKEETDDVQQEPIGVEEEGTAPEEDVAPPGEPSQGLTKGRGKYEKCPRCGNIALEVEIDRSAHCEYCGYIIRDIDEIREE